MLREGVVTVLKKWEKIEERKKFFCDQDAVIIEEIIYISEYVYTFFNKRLNRTYSRYDLKNLIYDFIDKYSNLDHSDCLEKIKSRLFAYVEKNVEKCKL